MVSFGFGLSLCSILWYISDTARVLSFLPAVIFATKLASMQAALMIRAKSRERRKLRLKKGLRAELPSNIATKSIAPFPRYPPASWCAAGRAAWQEAAALSVGGGGAGAGGAARRCSVLGDHPGARRDPRAKWHRTNRVRDASYGSSSESDGEGDLAGDTWGVARLLYAGLATLAVGLVVYFVGTGDKGFKTPALRLVGPTLIIIGLACCLLRILFCLCAKPCCRRRPNYKENRRLSGCVEGEEMPLAGGCPSTRAGPAQCSPARRLESSSCDVSSLSSGEEDERMRRYRTASAHPRSPQPRSSPQPQPSPQPQSIVVQASTALRTSPGVPSTSGTNTGRRPPPRNVSFAGGPDGELVLSPAQLRS